MITKNILSGPSFLPYEKPKKLIFMLHGYGDSAENFIQIASPLEKKEWKANYVALNAPSSIPNYSVGRQWFDLYPNGIYIAEAGSEEIAIIQNEVLHVVNLIENTINQIKNAYNLSFQDCFLMGFSQGGMMTFECGRNFSNRLGGLAILSGRIMSEDLTINKSLYKTPLFISHGDQDEVLPIKVFYDSCSYLKEHNLDHEQHLLAGDTHTISPEAIKLLQKFIKKNL
ncbi:dienelactone hydrolase family protein [Alphaproteobacteria bacterium]|nr:dienelactone hydrolase family protein [Alphaproteobacteria bacterium]